jgi:hypothetical protein
MFLGYAIRNKETKKILGLSYELEYPECCEEHPIDPYPVFFLSESEESPWITNSLKRAQFIVLGLFIEGTVDTPVIKCSAGKLKDYEIIEIKHTPSVVEIPVPTEQELYDFVISLAKSPKEAKNIEEKYKVDRPHYKSAFEYFGAWVIKEYYFRKVFHK